MCVLRGTLALRVKHFKQAACTALAVCDRDYAFKDRRADWNGVFESRRSTTAAIRSCARAQSRAEITSLHNAILEKFITRLRFWLSDTGDSPFGYLTQSGSRSFCKALLPAGSSRSRAGSGLLKSRDGSRDDPSSLVRAPQIASPDGSLAIFAE